MLANMARRWNAIRFRSLTRVGSSNYYAVMKEIKVINQILFRENSKISIRLPIRGRRAHGREHTHN